MSEATPGQTIGPFFGYALPYAGDAALVPPGSPGSVRLHGRVLDGAGDPVPDALIELWQADAAGSMVQRAGSLRRDGFTFTGWGRAATDPTGEYSFSTVVPGPVGGPGGGPAYVSLTVFARGLTNRLFTRAYLPVGEAGPAAGPGDDALLRSLDPYRRATLVAAADEHGFVFDIRLQGPGETVFLSYPRH